MIGVNRALDTDFRTKDQTNEVLAQKLMQLPISQGMLDSSTFSKTFEASDLDKDAYKAYDRKLYLLNSIT